MRDTISKVFAAGNSALWCLALARQREGAKSASGHVRLTNITISAARASPDLLDRSLSTATTSIHTHHRTLKSSPSLHSSTMLASRMTTQTAAPCCHFQPTGEYFRARELFHFLLRIHCIAFALRALLFSGPITCARSGVSKASRLQVCCCRTQAQCEGIRNGKAPRKATGHPREELRR